MRNILHVAYRLLIRSCNREQLSRSDDVGRLYSPSPEPPDSCLRMPETIDDEA